MNLAGQTVTVILTDDGKQVLKLASVNVPEMNMLIVSVEESDDMGLWIRIPREDQMHFLLVRWEYIIGIDVQSGMGKVIGMKPQP